MTVREKSAFGERNGAEKMNRFQTLASAAGLRTKKKFHFTTTFCLQDLVNCTYVTGLIFAKIRLKDGGSFMDFSKRVEVHSHCVKWNQEFEFPSKLYASASTAELEPCICKISIRKESKGGRSYKKLGFVKINLAEYAGAGETQRKYLLESYNEHKHKPDNSILKVKIKLSQTSGDVLFKAPRAPVWELSEPVDEGIEADLQSMRSRTSSSYAPMRTSTASTISGISTGGSFSSLRPGGSLQDMRRRSSACKETYRGQSVSASSLRSPSTESGSSESDVAQQCSEEEEREARLSEKADSKSPEPASSETASEESRDTPKNLSPRSRARREFRELGTLPEHLVISKGLQLSNGTASLPLRGSSTHRHRRQTSLGVITGSPLKVQHKRYQSITLSGTTSKSTSSYSTMSEKSLLESHETESLCSQRSRLTLFPSSRVEQSRVDNKSVVDELFQCHDLSRTDEEESSGGLKLFVDSKGTVMVTGEDLERKAPNMKPIDMRNHSAASKKKHRKGSGDSSTGDVKEAQDTRALEVGKDAGEVADDRNATQVVDSTDHSAASEKEYRKGSGDVKEAQDTRALEVGKDASEVADDRNATQVVDSTDTRNPASIESGR